MKAQRKQSRPHCLHLCQKLGFLCTLHSRCCLTPNHSKGGYCLAVHGSPLFPALGPFVWSAHISRFFSAALGCEITMVEECFPITELVARGPTIICKSAIHPETATSQTAEHMMTLPLFSRCLMKGVE